ncbi:Vegetative incompatibility protein HET-E-1 [Fusarium oxysporum f. sp. raphani]|uniref:Vegetative incompatibility protein HET-E-1 n=1 Tax=Fusarium oxysporum f. sp. raphani TaxID=96318 RepID=A0A8J5PWJ1_FUSOX|nr:Vegetative incompatibility protein HET-E-1 [Fusarium oxysporum f. sp. raphani]
MRFLNTETLKLHQFDDASAYPPYAVLSHCWYASERELIFKDFEDLSKHTSKPGYAKIDSACSAAITHGYEWLWVDNVCINGEDAIEKEETIKKLHSMFLKAGVCLIYMSEIPNANLNDDDQEILSSEARKNRWASRAWTYKEFIPLQKSVFYAADWSQLDQRFLTGLNTGKPGLEPFDDPKDDREHPHVSSVKPTGVESASPFTSASFAQAQGIGKEERTGQDSTTEQNSYPKIVPVRADLAAKISYDNSRGGYEEVQSENTFRVIQQPLYSLFPSQQDARILILDDDHMMRNTLSQLIQSVVTARVTVYSDFDIWESNHDIIFARTGGPPQASPPMTPQASVVGGQFLHANYIHDGRRTPGPPSPYMGAFGVSNGTEPQPMCHPYLINMGPPLLSAPSYKPQGTVRILKRVQYIPTAETVSSLIEQGKYRIFCRSSKRNALVQLISETSKKAQVYENDYELMFDESSPDGHIRKPILPYYGNSISDFSLRAGNVIEPAGHLHKGPLSSNYLDSHNNMGHLPNGQFVNLRPMKNAGPTDSVLHEPSPLEGQSYPGYISVNSEGTADSPQSSTFDLTIHSRETCPSTVPASLPHKSQRPSSDPTVSQRTMQQTEEEETMSSVQGREGEDRSPPGKCENERDNFDTATTYSVGTLSDDPKFQYFQAFIGQLTEDVGAGADGTTLKDVGQSFLDQTLRDFAWRLHEESTNPFQLETSVIIHRKRRNIVDLLDFQVPAFDEAESESGQSLWDSEAENEEEPSIVPFRKAEEMIIDWIGEVETGKPNDISQMLQYRKFIQGSKAYEWLLTKICQQSRLSCEEPNLMDSVGSTIRNELKERIPRHKMSRRKASIWFEMTYSLTLDLIGIMKKSGISGSCAKALPNILCLTGNWNEAQATTVSEYMNQTWPQSGMSMVPFPKTDTSDDPSGRAWTEGNGERSSSLCLLKGTVNPDCGRTARYEISARGGYYAVSEVGEQIAWLASVFQNHTGFVSIMPSITNFSASAVKNKSGSTIAVMGSCSFYFFTRPETTYNPNQGFCWERLFGSRSIVRGYPILRRSIPKSGLEVPLLYAASIVGSSEVVQWDKRLVIKGFNMLMVATQVTSDVMVWHLLVSEKPEERISYLDPRLDHIDIRPSDEMSLRYIEGKRHIVGWCTKATDFCGHSTANHMIKPGGLPKASASIVVDKLYIEGGSPVTAGLMLDVNKKEQPFWLQREKDYPSFLNWVKLQPVVFYDVEERRAWLVDGASALLHLVRISLHLDINDPESAYDWVYDPSKVKDHWPGVGSRQAALQTLKSWENRALNVYIVNKHIDPNGVPVTKYSTFEERVKTILHSIEKLIDRQAQAASQDGIKISQALDPRRDVVGFDIVDIIDPSVPIYPRIQHLNSWGHGWIDLIPTIGITALFGRGFGDLIRADEPDLICPSWRSVPVGKDYLAASISTMQMLHEKRLLRMEPGLIGGELTKKITWVTAKEASLHCRCLKRQGSNDAQTTGAECNHNPVQFLAKRWWSRTIPHGLKPVQLGSLDPEGAVIFGHTVLGLRTGERSAPKQADDDGAASTTSGEQTQQASATGSIVSRTTSITVPSVGASSQDAASVQQSLHTNKTTSEGKKKRWSRFKDWVKR